MNTQKKIWGKILGTLFGFMMAGPLGAMIGLFIGNYFDRGLTEHFNQPLVTLLDLKHKPIFTTWIETCFASLGSLSKADGNVTPQAIELTEATMKELQLNQTQRKNAKVWFRSGKQTSFNLTAQLILLKSQAQGQPRVIILFINLIYEFSKTLGMSSARITKLNDILKTLGYAPIQHQQKYYDYDPFNQYRYQHQQSYDQSSQTHRQNRHNMHLDEAYVILNVPPQADQSTIKKAYRRLISQHHPDRMIAQKRSAIEIKQANEKTQKIRQAYETICAERQWNS